MKTFGTTANISIGSNKVISSTSCNWVKITPGSFFKFKKDTEWFKVLNTKEIFWIKNFTSKHKNIITLSENAFPILQPLDELELTYKEYELESIKIISQVGINYSVGEIVYVNGGNLSPDLQQPAAIKILSLGENGSIGTFEIFNKGKYLSFPKDEVSTTSTGAGHGAKFYLNFREIESRGWIDKKIAHINYANGETIIALNSSLPEGLENGKISVKKWELIIDKNYFIRNSNVNSEEYEIHKDFIPGSPIPLLIKGSSNPDFVINQGFALLWNEISELKKKIEEYERE